MNNDSPVSLWSIIIGVVAAALGCYLSDRLIPGGTPRLLAQVGSVACGMAVAAGGRLLR